MKKIIKTIILLSIIFSSLSKTFAEEGYIEKLFNLNYSVEEYNLNLVNIKIIHFKNEKYNKMYNELKNIDLLLKNGFIEKYKNGEFEYYQINGIIKNYNNFIYYTNQFFSSIKLKENYNYIELDTAIINNSKNMRSSYYKVKNIVKGY